MGWEGGREHEEGRVLFEVRGRRDPLLYSSEARLETSH